MRYFLFIIVCIFGFVCKAQVDVLVNNDWYLEKLVLNGEDFPLPENYEQEYAFILLDFTSDEDFVTSACNTYFSPIVYNDDDSFELLGLGNALENCEDQTIGEYDVIYSTFYHLGVSPPISYSYSINYNGTSLQLTIENPNQNLAIYNSSTLSSSNFEAQHFAIYPNPVTNQLHIDSQEAFQRVEVFTINGKRILEANYQENRPMDVSSLPSGLYILKIETENGSVTKKLVKE